MKEVFEVRDTTNDEMYFPMGLFKTIEEIELLIEKVERSGEALTEYGAEEGECEEITVVSRQFGWSEYSTTVLTINREQYYDDAADEYKWRKITK